LINYLGEIAGLAASVMFSASSTLFAMVSRQVGALNVNRLRLVLAIGWLLLAHLLLRTPLPVHAGAQRWFWLSVSGILGLVLGDLFLFQAYIWIGPRLTMLLMALSPALAVLLAWWITGETLAIPQVLGIGLTMGGIAWVVSERNQGSQQTALNPRHYWLGVLCGLGAAAGQAMGLVTARLGTAGGYPAISATLIRMIAAVIVMWTITLLSRQGMATLQTFARQPQAIWLALSGSFFGPFLGVTLSLYAIQHTAVGVASTLTSLAPVILLPVGYIFFNERFGWQAVAGTLLATAGVAMLFLV
jgi:drug/metabolite transporter (DMT)-like permease